MTPTLGTPFAKVVRYVALDGLLLGLSWCFVYYARYGQSPQLSRGPIALILCWLLAQYVLGTYSDMARRQLQLRRQLGNCTVAVLFVLMLAFGTTALRGDPFISTMGRGFLFPVVGLGFLSTQVIRVVQGSSHLFRPQQHWLMFVSSRERCVLSREIEHGGCVIPCGLEWRAVHAMPALPSSLPSLLDIDGVVITGDHQLSEEDRRTLIHWQHQGVRLLSVQGWSELFLRRLPPSFVPDVWADRVQFFSHSRTGPNSRLKRLADVLVSLFLLVLLLPINFLYKPNLFIDYCVGRDGRPFHRLRLQAASRISAVPQLINVLRGEMSLVGPRPLTLAAMQQLEARFPGAELRQWMRPGMTGWGRVAGPPPVELDAIAWELGRDLFYLRKHSLLLDLRLLATSLLILLFPAPWRR